MDQLPAAMDDLWQVAGGLCCILEPGGATGHAVHTRITAHGVVLGTEELDTAGALQAESRSQAAQPRRWCCCAGRESARSLRTGAELLRFEDLLGAVLDPAARLIRLVHCPVVSGSRVRQDVLLHVGGAEKVLAPVQEWTSQVCERCAVKGSRRYHALINPASGSGGAAATWQQVSELFSHLPYLQVMETFTTRAGQASDIAFELDLAQCDGIIVVSGDGMVHELFNGLTRRSDRAEALKVPVGHVPAGSGNALAKSILHSCGEAFGPLDAAFVIAKGQTQDLDLMTVSQPGQPDRTSFLGLSAGVIADLDIGSESLRFMGGFRFTAYAAVCIACPRPLTAELQYWPASAGEPPGPAPAIDSELPPGPWVTISGSFTVLWSSSMEWTSYNIQLAPGLCMGDGVCSLILLRDAGRVTLTKFLLALESDGGHLAVDGAEKLETVFESEASRLSDCNGVSGQFACRPLWSFA